MCRLFYPETDMISGSGFNRAVEHEIKTWYTEAVCTFDKESIIPETIKEETGLVLFGILLEIFALIKGKNKGRLSSITIKYTRKKVNIVIDYSGELIKRNKKDEQVNSLDRSIFERAELLGGDLQIKNAEHDCRRIKLVIPIN